MLSKQIAIILVFLENNNLIIEIKNNFIDIIAL